MEERIQVQVHGNSGEARDELRQPLLEPRDDSTTTRGNNDEQNASVVIDENNVIIPNWLVCCRNRRLAPLQLNHNVAFILMSSVFFGISDSLWGGTVIAAYLKKLGHDRNSPVGDVEAANGLATLISAFPVGYLADHYGRSKVIAAGGGLMMITAALHAILLAWIGVQPPGDDDGDGGKHHTGSESEFWLLSAVMALWGVGGAIINGPAQALYADSTPVGQRSTYYVYSFACYMLATCIGPLVSIVLFQTIGDQWDLKNLRSVIFVGLAFSVINSVMMLFADDNKVLNEAVLQEQEEPNDETDANKDNFPGSGEASDEECTALEESQEDANRLANTDTSLIESRRKFIPYIIFVHSCMLSVGAGMTIKFFPLFFKDDIGMSPSQVQVIYVIVPIVMVLCSGLGKVLASTGFGRVQTALLLKILGVSGLYIMVFCKKYLDAHPFVLIPIYIMRTSLINAPYPLQESILMDYVSKNERARWKSLDAVAMFGWCGSAALGGWLTDKYDYTYTFLITAILQTVGIMIFTLLLPLVPRKEADLATPTRDSISTRRRAAGIVDTSSTASISDSNPSSNADLLGFQHLQEPLLLEDTLPTNGN